MTLFASLPMYNLPEMRAVKGRDAGEIGLRQRSRIDASVGQRPLHIGKTRVVDLEGFFHCLYSHCPKASAQQLGFSCGQTSSFNATSPSSATLLH